MSKNAKADFLAETFGNQFWNNVVYYSIFDVDFLKKVRNMVPLEVFRSKERKIIMREIYNYYDTYKQAPDYHFYDMFQELEKSLSDSDYERCMNLIGILKSITGKNSRYIYDKINDAIRHYRLEEGSVEFASLIKRKKYDEAKAHILKAMKASEEEEESEYYDYFEDKSYIEKRLQEVKHKMRLLVPGIDNIIGGVNPPWLIIFLGATKGGKSWWLAEMAVAAVFQGLNVMYVSLEMDKDVVDTRLDQIIGFMSSRESDEPQNVMSYKRKEWVKSQEVVSSIYDISAVEKNRQRLRKIGGGGLKVLAFHRGRKNYLDIDRILDESEEKDGFVTDVLIVDYLGNMKETAQGQSKKERIGENCLGLKEICGKRKIICFSAMQGNRKAMTAKTFHSHMVADDIDTIFHADLIPAICQTKREEEKGQYRIYCANFRHGPQHWSVGLVRDLTVGQIAIGEFEIKDSMEEEEAEEDKVY